MTRAEKRRNLYTSSSKYRNWPRLGLGAVGLRSLGLADLGAGLCKRNSVLNVALAENYPNHTTDGQYCLTRSGRYTYLLVYQLIHTERSELCGSYADSDAQNMRWWRSWIRLLGGHFEWFQQSATLFCGSTGDHSGAAHQECGLTLDSCTIAIWVQL